MLVFQTEPAGVVTARLIPLRRMIARRLGFVPTHTSSCDLEGVVTVTIRIVDAAATIAVVVMIVVVMIIVIVILRAAAFAGAGVVTANVAIAGAIGATPDAPRQPVITVTIA